MHHRHHPPAALILVLLLLLAPLDARATQAPSSAAITADPQTITVDIPLGERASRTVQLAGLAAGQSPAVFEAQAEPAKSRAIGPARVALPQQQDRMDSKIAADAAASPDGRAEFMVFLRDQADLSAAYGIADWSERGRFVQRTLAEHAERTQAGLRAQLAARGVVFEPLWIVNAIRVRGTIADAQALSGRADVALLRANRVLALPAAATTQADIDRCSPDQPGNPVCWNIRRIGADRVWRDFGVDGGGVTVANIDTGVLFNHVALAGRYRGNAGGQFDHNYNWFDPQGSRMAPMDGNGHGTHTMGTIVGRGGGSGRPAIGAAPGASWIAAQGCEGDFCDSFDLIAAAQWLLAPTDLTGANPRPDLRPMVINNSWGGVGGSDWYAGYTAAWRAAGMFPVFAAGNADGSRGQVCGSVNSPGDYADVVAVGATDHTDTVARFSLLGPSADGRQKPDFSAPGTHTGGQIGIYSAGFAQADSYRALQGTSMATPLVAGVVALLWSANPSLIGDYEATYAILRDTSQRLSDTRCGDAPGAPNNVYGHGRIDAYAAVSRARVDVPWLVLPEARPTAAGDGSASFELTLAADLVPGPGSYTARLQVYGADLGQPPTTIAVTMNVTPIASPAIVSGRVLSSTGEPLVATVGLQGGLAVTTGPDGAYTLTLKPGDYTLTASALSFLPATQPVGAAPGPNVQDIVLQPDQARIELAAPPVTAELGFGQERTIAVTLTNPGRRTLYYSASAPATQYSVHRSDSRLEDAPSYRWVELPADAPTLALAPDGFSEEVPLGIPFPFYSYVLTETLVTADGMLAFDTPFGYQGPSSRCFPADEIGFYTIAPLRADLDPSRGGAVRYGTVEAGRTFVLSYEDVPRDDGPADETYSFQALLHSDGRIVFQYRSLARRTASMSAGLQRSPWEYQEIGCGPGLQISEELAIELRPQLSSERWLTVSPSEGEVAPGQQATLEIRLAWARPAGAGPYQGTVKIRSNDTRSPLVTLPAEVELRAAPNEQALPYLFRPR
jgi:subtilisin family serine protease